MTTGQKLDDLRLLLKIENGAFSRFVLSTSESHIRYKLSVFTTSIISLKLAKTRQELKLAQTADVRKSTKLLRRNLQ